MNIWGPDFGGDFTFELPHYSFHKTFGKEKNNYLKRVGFKVVEQEIDDHGDAESPIKKKKAILTSSLTHKEIKAKNYAQVFVQDGLIDEVKVGDKTLLWIIDPTYFTITTESSVPSNQANILSEAIDEKTKFYQRYEVPKNTAEFDAFKAAQGKGQATFISTNPKGKTDNPSNTPFLNLHRDEKQKIGLAPMGQKMDARHTVEVYKINTQVDDFKGPSIHNFHVRLDTKNFSKQLYGTVPLDVDHPHNNDFKSSQVENTLKGITLMPPVFFPAKTKSIPFYYLIFSLGNEVYLGAKQLPHQDLIDAKAVTDIEELSFEQSTSAIEQLKKLARGTGLFDHLQFKGNQKAKIDYWDAPLNCELAAEANQF